MALLFSLRKKDSKGSGQNNNREQKTNGECGGETQRQRETERDECNLLEARRRKENP